MYGVRPQKGATLQHPGWPKAFHRCYSHRPLMEQRDRLHLPRALPVPGVAYGYSRGPPAFREGSPSLLAPCANSLGEIERIVGVESQVENAHLRYRQTDVHSVRRRWRNGWCVSGDSVTRSAGVNGRVNGASIIRAGNDFAVIPARVGAISRTFMLGFFDPTWAAGGALAGEADNGVRDRESTCPRGHNAAKLV
jgi:hypothetical protein